MTKLGSTQLSKARLWYLLNYAFSFDAVLLIETMGLGLQLQERLPVTNHAPGQVHCVFFKKTRCQLFFLKALHNVNTILYM